MINPVYAGDFQAEPRPESACTFSFQWEPGPKIPRKTITVGIKTLTHDRAGNKLRPTKVVAIDMVEESELASFDLPAAWARILARRLVEFADVLDTGEAKP